VPLLNASERAGVLALTFASLNDSIRRQCDELGRALGELIVVRGLYTDAYARCRRRAEMSVAGELQWQILPPLGAEVPSLTVAGLLEPAYDVGGDGFDFALNGDDLDLIIYDAVGHDLQSSVLSALVMASFRQARRAGYPLDQWCSRADQAVQAAFSDLSYATAQVARLHGPTGVLRWVNAGHPLPLLVRGGRVVGEISGAVRPPVGLGHLRLPANDPTTETSLEPGDRVLFYSDGLVEGGHDRRQPFGVERLVDLLERAQMDQLACAETLRRLAQAVLDHSEYRLRDDATLLLVEWRGPSANIEHEARGQ
jgi:serine phosphatase RsbU (regulator of sigma subunit)